MPSKCTAAHLLVRPQGHDFARQRDKRGSRELTVGVQDGNTFQEGRFVVPVSVEPGMVGMVHLFEAVRPKNSVKGRC